MEYQKQPKQLVILLVIKLLIKLQKFCNNVIQKQLQINMVNNYLKKDVISRRKTEEKQLQINLINIYLKKDIYLQKKDRKKKIDDLTLT